MPDEHDSISLVKKDRDKDYGSTAEKENTEELDLNAVYEKIGDLNNLISLCSFCEAAVNGKKL